MTDQQAGKPVEDLASMYPAVDVAYDACMRTYDQMLVRYEAAQSGLTNVINYATTLTAALLAFSAAYKREPQGWFFIGIICYACLIVVAIVTRNWKGVRLNDPSVVFDSYLSNTPWEFRKNMIYWAADSFKDNTRTVLLKWRWQVVAQILLAIEVIALGLWVAGQGS